MDKSVFTDKAIKPDELNLSQALGNTYSYWQQIRTFVLEKYPAAIEEWNFPGVKYGWSFRIKDKKRAIIYLLPREKYFKAAFVFGQKATDLVLSSNISEEIKTELQQARVYAEGRGVRIDVFNLETVNYIKTLVEIKIAN